MQKNSPTETTPKDSRRYVATGVANIQRLERHGGDTKGPLYFLVKRQGKRIRRALDTCDLKEGQKRARLLLEMVKGEKWAELQGVKARAGWASLPELFEVYLRAASIRSAARNVKMMKHLLRVAGKNPNGFTDQLGAHTVWEFQQAMVKAAGEDLRAQGRAAISANSIVRQARSLFAAAVMPAYRDLVLPDLSGFLKAPKLREPAVQYVEPPAAVIETIGARYGELKATDPGAYAVFLLGAFLGLRNAEVKAAEWGWIEPDGAGVHWLRLATRPHWKTKTARARDVEMPVEILRELQELRGVKVEGVEAEAAFLVPAHHATERGTRVFRRLNAWLRGCGLEVDAYPKGFYELRKHFLNRKAWELGSYRAARVGGNSPRVVEKYYSSDGGRAPVALASPGIDRHGEARSVPSVEA